MKYKICTSEQVHGSVETYEEAEIMADWVANETKDFVWVTNLLGEIVYSPNPEQVEQIPNSSLRVH